MAANADEDLHRLDPTEDTIRADPGVGWWVAPMNDTVFGQPLEIWLARVPVVICEGAETRNLSVRNVGDHPEANRHQTASGDDSDPYRQLGHDCASAVGPTHKPHLCSRHTTQIVFLRSRRE